MKTIIVLISLLIAALSGYGQKKSKDAITDKEPIAVAEFGGASSFNLKGGSSSGYNIAVEVTPIEDWLELEAGVSPVWGNHSHETDVDFLFKKPWTFSPKAEFMLGIGPGWSHENDRGATSNNFSGEVALDFMFWPFARHRFGWYLEPGYEYGLSHGHEQSVGISAGLLVGI